MKPEIPDDALLEQGLAAWDVPEPAPSLIERILSQNAETLTALSTPPTPTELPALEPAPLQEDTPAMLPTDLRTERSMRPFWTATLLGFAAAAAIVLAFMAGRQSNPPAPLAPVVPSVEIQVSAPAPVAVPPAPPAPPAVPQEITAPQSTEAVPAPPPTPPTPRVRRGRRSEGISPDLKNPFGSSSGSDDAQSPFGSQTQGSQDADGSTITSPFSQKTATLRVGTHPGSPPADITVDGKSVGRTPLSAVKVSPGEHTVVFRWPNKRQSVTVEVEANKSKIVRAGNE